MKFSIKDFFSHIWSHLLKKSTSFLCCELNIQFKWNKLNFRLTFFNQFCHLFLLVPSTKLYITLREKCPNTEFFLVRIFLYSFRIQENTDQKKLRIWKMKKAVLKDEDPITVDTVKDKYLLGIDCGTLFMEWVW